MATDASGRGPNTDFYVGPEGNVASSLDEYDKFLRSVEAQYQSKLKWGNPKSVPTYGHSISGHGSKMKPSQLIDRARNKGHQIGQWLDDVEAAKFMEKIAKERGGGAHTVDLPEGLKGRSFLADGTELPTDKAIIVVYDTGGINSGYPINSKFPTTKPKAKK